jgi:hypothetical protein
MKISHRWRCMAVTGLYGYSMPMQATESLIEFTYFVFPSKVLKLFFLPRPGRRHIGNQGLERGYTRAGYVSYRLA